MKQGFWSRRAVGHTVLARVAAGRVACLWAVPDQQPGAIGQLYRGRVTRIVDGLRAAFVDVGLGRPGFLSVEDAPEAAGDAAGEAPIRERVRQGEWLIVQVRREAANEKGVRLTTRCALPGTWLVLNGGSPPGVAISHKLTDAVVRERLLAELSPLAQAHGVGFVARTAAAEATGRDLELEADRLSAMWKRMQRVAGALRAPAALGAAISPAARLIEEHWGPSDEGIVADDPAHLRAMLAALGDDAPASRAPIFAMDTEIQTQLQRTLTKALSETVHLASGARLVITPTEALCAIDVNTGQAVAHSGRKGEQAAAAIAKTNVEAAHAVAEQIVLRGVGGLIAVDFIDQRSETHREAVREAMQQALGADPEKSYVGRMDELGVLTMTRRQRRPPLHQTLRAPCIACAGRGAVAAPWHVASEAVWAARRWLEEMPQPMLLVHVGEAVAQVLHADGASMVDAAERAHDCQIVVVAKAQWPSATYELLSTAPAGYVRHSAVQ